MKFTSLIRSSAFIFLGLLAGASSTWFYLRNVAKQSSGVWITNYPLEADGIQIPKDTHLTYRFRSDDGYDHVAIQLKVEKGITGVFSKMGTMPHAEAQTYEFWPRMVPKQ